MILGRLVRWPREKGIITFPNILRPKIYNMAGKQTSYTNYTLKPHVIKNPIIKFHTSSGLVLSSQPENINFFTI